MIFSPLSGEVIQTKYNQNLLKLENNKEEFKTNILNKKKITKSL